jgi:hypothetical protein
VRETIGTPGRPLYFLHIPKTAGTAFGMLLEDAFPAGACMPARRADQLAEQRLAGAARGHGLLTGHFGTAPLALGPMTTVTVLRDPAARAWSHFRFIRACFPEHAPRELDDFLADPVLGLLARDYQARWLAMPHDERAPLEVPAARYLPTDADGAHTPPPELERAAEATLAGCALAGTAERLPETVDALGRLLGRPLPQPARVNVTPGRGTIPPGAAARIRATSPIDARLHAEAERRLDGLLATLPPPPPEPPAALPYAYEMDEALHGTGLLRRVWTAEAGWHRWTGPGTECTLRLPVRLSGPATLAVAILSACDDDAVRSVRLAVQGAPVAHRLAPPPHGGTGVVALADAVLDPARPLELGVTVDHTRPLIDAATGEASPQAAGLALGAIAFR